MTALQKANELTTKFRTILEEDDITYQSAVRCALITVEEVINGSFGDGYNHKHWLEVQSILKEKLSNKQT